MRSLKIYKAGKLQRHALPDHPGQYPLSRMPALGDLRAQMASCQIGAKRYCRTRRRVTAAGVRWKACVESNLGSCREVRGSVRSSSAFRTAPIRAESYLDNDGRDLATLKLNDRRQGHRLVARAITVDFSRHASVRCRGPLNSGRSGRHRRRPALPSRHSLQPRRSMSTKAASGALNDRSCRTERSCSARGRRRRSASGAFALPTVIDTILKALRAGRAGLDPGGPQG